MSGTEATSIAYTPGALDRCFALVDCDNFFASCERVFRPELKNQPVVVLSSNDGCIVARSNEAKALGIGMGEPFFQCRRLIEKHRVNVFSSNFPLYGDMSRRVMAILSRFAPEMEIYSIDEAFLDLRRCDHLARCDNLTEYAHTIRDTVKQWTGIPVSIGIARTQTLAKIAAHLAKRSAKAKGVLDLTDSPFIDQALESVEVGDVWGVGWRSTEWLVGRGITNARQLRDMDDKTISRKMGVTGVRLIYELRGISCFSLTTVPPPSKSVISSQSFGHKTDSLETVKGAVASHIAAAAEKMRSQHLAAKELTVFMMTNCPDGKYGKNNHSTGISLPQATNDTAELIHYAMQAADIIHRKGYIYVKAGVMFSNLIPENHVQATLFTAPDNANKNKKLMNTIDRVNTSMGRGTLRYAVQLQALSSRAKHEHGRFRYTTNWQELVVVKAV
ncbi:MAG TPA: Y-family DNA polymerase [candidate division Zixibacteria bacterium]|nr:Y-family DNA polymerase [candidate division Zixibacteria bacterium]